MDRTLHLVALIGTPALFVLLLVRDLPTADSGLLLFGVMLAISAAALLAMALTTSAAARRLRRHPKLLTPLAFFVMAHALLAWVIGPDWNHGTDRIVEVPFLGTLECGFSNWLVLAVILDLVYAAWATTAVLRTLYIHDPSITGAFRRGLGWLPRVIWIHAVGWTFPFFVFVASGELEDMAGSGGLAVAALFSGSLWAMVSTAFLPAMLEVDLPLRTAFWRGWWAGWGGMRFWWPAAFLQALLAGCVTFVYGLDYQGDLVGHLMWAGGYDQGARWVIAHADYLEIPAPLYAVLFTQFALGVFALAVKIQVVEDLPDAEL